MMMSLLPHLHMSEHERVSQAASMERFQIIKYFDPNISAFLSDKKEMEVALVGTDKTYLQ